ncbi:hypothetical protein UPYG_G00055220 [Umbra pygmaea]|uniref:Uncharacterized protein n=1 Tax=Umbra pygmaea TaxID=75934 RepID=A0ABD0XVJ0_UMBPY
MATPSTTGCLREPSGWMVWNQHHVHLGSHNRMQPARPHCQPRPQSIIATFQGGGMGRLSSNSAPLLPDMPGDPPAGVGDQGSRPLREDDEERPYSSFKVDPGLAVLLTGGA